MERMMRGGVVGMPGCCGGGEAEAEAMIEAAKRAAMPVRLRTGGAATPGGRMAMDRMATPPREQE